MTHDAELAAPPRRMPVSGPLLVILVTVFLNIVGLGLILPVLPFYATAYGANGEQVALLFTMFSGLQFLTSPVFGALSDRFGRRPIILFGIVGEFIGYLILGSATSLTVVFVSRLVAGATAGNISATQAYVADITPFKERTRAYSLVGAAFGAGLLFGPALGGALTLVDNRAPAFGAGVLVALNFLFAYVALPESHRRERRSHKPIANQFNPFSVMVPLVRRPVLRGPLVATFFLNVALTGFQANFAVFASGRFGLGPTEVAELFVASGLANIVVQAILVPRLTTRISDATLVLAGSAVNAAGNLATGFTPIPSVFWGSLPTLTGGYSLTRGPLTSLITKLVPPTEQGMANGGVQATISLAGVVGPILAGIGYESVGRSSPYWTSALVVGLAALAVALRVRPTLVPTDTLPTPQPANPPRPAAAATADPPAVEETRDDGFKTVLSGSLDNLGLPPIVRFLTDLNKSGCLRLWRGDWSGEVCFDRGELVLASFAAERGRAALDAILLVLSDGHFTFAEGVPGPDRNLKMDVEELEAHLASQHARHELLSAAIRSPMSVPRIVETGDQPEPADVVLDRSTLQTLLAVDGKRTIEEIGARYGLAQTLKDLVTLLDLGLIRIEELSTEGAPRTSEVIAPNGDLRRSSGA